MEGYKVFEPDWTCRGFQYAVGKTFEEDVTPSCCNRGFHFCKELKDCFNTEEPKIFLFNKPSDWTYRDWLNSDARYLLNQIPRNVVDWIWSDDMTDEEKEQHPEYEVVGGYLKILDESECGQLWWDSLYERYKNIIKAMPNFDKEIFEDVTGIKI